jgi:hypothetical protein
MHLMEKAAWCKSSGKRGTSSIPLNGYIYEVAIFSGAFDQEQIRRMKVAGLQQLIDEAGASDTIDGNVRAEDDVKVKARCDIEVFAAIEAFDRIDLSAKDNLTLFPGSSLSGINGEKARKVSLRAGGDTILDGTIKAEKLSVH